MDLLPPTDGAGLLSMIEDLKADVTVDEESYLKYKELVLDAEKHRAKATDKLGERKKSLALLSGYLKTLKKNGTITPEQEASVRSSLDTISPKLSKFAQIRGDTGSLFVRLFLGQVNVKVPYAKDAAKLRDEYNKFKDRTNIGFVIFPLLWIFTSRVLAAKFAYTDWVFTLTQIWLLYYYVSLSLRENILRVNGSNIRPWWIYHHYVSAVMSMIMLTWPSDSLTWRRSLPHFTLYFLYQGVVQFMQAAYQKKRHYALRALGKAGNMDVTHTETITEFHAGLFIIVGLVIVAQAWQVYNGLTLFSMLWFDLDRSVKWYNYREEFQCFALAILFVFLGVTNFVTTVQTLLDKGKREKARRAAASSNARGVAAVAGNGASGGGASPTVSEGSGSSSSGSPLEDATLIASASGRKLQ